ncbi:ABC transporter substrate-binding protein [Devosia ginsengisoli]|uniref:ABC transporter substrate-binding protein n=1 Tax=Devosia ginsengisoli TaxID=400770 RepID=A0A5B8LZH3_9HYPH|nr:ABC transporter substrate-binding protein [Devosia ginsengisoli]QDZ12772.1 ABC transporter substrate-binding protein [Devosia ginsengisoli]
MTFHLGKAALAISLVSLTIASVQAQELTVTVSGGAFADALIEAFVKPFEEETGIKVNAVKAEIGSQRWGLAVETNTVDWDVGLTNTLTGPQLAAAGTMIPIDYSLYDQRELDGIAPQFRRDWGVGAQVSALVLAYNTETLPEGKRPQSWADFWNVEGFPGVRTMMMPYVGSSSLPEALVADGVPLDQVYPLDVDRAFSKLDEIKPHIRKWWATASDAQQMFNAGEVDMGLSFDGRIVALQKAGVPVEFTFNGARYYSAMWAIPKGAKNVADAQRFIEFATRGEHQATLARIMGYAPANSTAFDYLPEELAATLVTAPGNIDKAYPIDGDWYSEVGPDGKTNGERITERWQDWILQ